jgi:glycosyltransferase involved in cell wall biosynthesis
LADAPTVFFLARLDRTHYFKGLHLLIDAVAKLPDAVLVVGGDGEWRAQYQARARASLGARAHFIGDVPDSALPSYYRAADVVAVPSIDRTEAFGLVLLEDDSDGPGAGAGRVGTNARPLPAALRRDAGLAAAEALLATGERRLRSLTGRLVTDVVAGDTWRVLDPAASTLRDVDAPEDLPPLR